jgi:nitrogenase molybdenum-iron protein alpha/beta subunit
MARRPGPVTRERRLQGISAYLDKPDALAAEFAAGEVPQRIRTFSQAAPDDLVAALDLLGRVKDIAIVVHGPRGCGAVLAASNPHAHWAVTGLDQRDTIMGCEGVVERAVLALVRRHKPGAVFVVTTPVVAINSDDGRDVVLSLTDELGIPVQLVRTDGFRSRIAATGYDAACQALLNLVPPVSGLRQESFINLLARDEVLATAAAMLLADQGLEVNVLPAGAKAQAFERAGRARLSVCLDPEATGAFATGLEAAHGVPVLHAGLPIGLAATQSWEAAVAAAVGLPVPSDALVREGSGLSAPPDATTAGSDTPGQESSDAGDPASADHGSADIARRADAGLVRAMPDGLQRMVSSQHLSGVRVHLALPPEAGFAAAILVGELGGTVSGLSVGHIDSTHAEAPGVLARTGATLHVAAGQPFELVNLLRSQRPDLFVGDPELAALAAAAGVPAVGATPAALIGWRGAAWLAERAGAALRNPAFVRRLAGAASPYAAGWLRRSADWHVKQEVR